MCLPRVPLRYSTPPPLSLPRTVRVSPPRVKGKPVKKEGGLGDGDAHPVLRCPVRLRNSQAVSLIQRVLMALVL